MKRMLGILTLLAMSTFSVLADSPFGGPDGIECPPDCCSAPNLN